MPAATAAEPAHHPVNLSLYYPVATSGDPDLTTTFRLAVLYGRVGEIRGLDLTGGVSVIGRDMRGLQLAGLYSHVGGDLRGVGLTGLVSRVQGDVVGVQAAGLANVDRGRVRGVQLSGLFNFAEGGHSGVQIASVYNYAQGPSGFLQYSAVANVSDGGYAGFQIAPGFNFASPYIAGVQLGAANLAAEMSGIQIGLVNLTRQGHGLQLGALNLNGSHDGVPIGLYNGDRDHGRVDWVTFGSNLAAVSTGVRTTVNGFHSMLTAGYGDLQGDIEKAGFLTWNYGYSWRLGGRWRLLLDGGIAHIMPEKSSDPDENDRLHFALQARALAEIRFGPRASAFAGGGLSFIWDEYSTSASQETEPLIVAGISLF